MGGKNKTQSRCAASHLSTSKHATGRRNGTTVLNNQLTRTTLQHEQDQIRGRHARYGKYSYTNVFPFILGLQARPAHDAVDNTTEVTMKNGVTHHARNNARHPSSSTICLPQSNNPVYGACCVRNSITSSPYAGGAASSASSAEAAASRRCSVRRAPMTCSGVSRRVMSAMTGRDARRTGRRWER